MNKQQITLTTTSNGYEILLIKAKIANNYQLYYTLFNEMQGITTANNNKEIPQLVIQPNLYPTSNSIKMIIQLFRQYNHQVYYQNFMKQLQQYSLQLCITNNLDQPIVYNNEDLRLYHKLCYSYDIYYQIIHYHSNLGHFGGILHWLRRIIYFYQSQVYNDANLWNLIYQSYLNKIKKVKKVIMFIMMLLN